MRRLCGWGERQINFVPSEVRGAVRGKRCVRADIGNYECAEFKASEELRQLVERLVLKEIYVVS